MSGLVFETTSNDKSVKKYHGQRCEIIRTVPSYDPRKRSIVKSYVVEFKDGESFIAFAEELFIPPKERREDPILDGPIQIRQHWSTGNGGTYLLLDATRNGLLYRHAHLFDRLAVKSMHPEVIVEMAVNHAIKATNEILTFMHKQQQEGGESQ